MFFLNSVSRVFKLLLRPDQSLFADDVEFEGAKGKRIDFDVGTAYIGTLEGKWYICYTKRIKFTNY